MYPMLHHPINPPVKRKIEPAPKTSKRPRKEDLTPEEIAFNSKLKDQSSLRFISSKVCDIVEKKGTTTYNEVANDLVQDALKLFRGESYPDKKRKDHEKNIRRRVYDALNVLLATEIIQKTKEKGDKEKTIHWRGFPKSSSLDLVNLEKEKSLALAEIERKKECLRELLVQNICFRNLEKRNNRYRLDEVVQEEEKIALPFIVVNTAENAAIQCEMSHDKTDVMFDFNMPFEINDDNEILKRLGLSHASMEDLEEILTPEIFQYCKEHQIIDTVLHQPQTYPGYPYHHHSSHPPINHDVPHYPPSPYAADTRTYAPPPPTHSMPPHGYPYPYAHDYHHGYHPHPSASAPPPVQRSDSTGEEN